MKIDTTVELVGGGLHLSPMVASDYAALFSAASDPLIWAGHPARERYTEAVFRPYFDALLEVGGTYVIRREATGEVIGCSRYYVAEDAPEDIGIGFTFITRACWGGSVNFELKRVMLAHAYEHYDRVWLHIAPGNIRSQKAAENLGAAFEGEAVITLLGAPSRNLRYCLAKEGWSAKMAALQNEAGA